MKTPRTPSIHAASWLLAGLLLLPTGAKADFFTYQDSSGAVVMTNRLEDVPKKYRQRVKVVWDKDLEAKDPLARRSAEADRLREQREPRREQQKPVARKTINDGKTLVITIDEETGQLIRRFE